jgi:Cellulase (glycosyl hydrolase family 5)
MSGSTSASTAAANSQFHVSNGQIIDLYGQPFIAHGVAIVQGNKPSASTLQSSFPDINFVRLAIYDFTGASALQGYVNELTSAGIVVAIEDHSNNQDNAGGGRGTIFTGQQLKTELDWYSSIASTFKGNPNVWFGTNNEPSETNASGQTDTAALSIWQQQTYDAIRNTGNTSPVMVEMNSLSPASTGRGYTPSVYAAMSNIVWDIHYYGWLSGFSTDQTTVTQTLDGMVTKAQTLTSMDGTVPVIIGEYGNSTSGAEIDANGYQVVQAVLDTGLGNAAWAYSKGKPGDGLINADGSLTSYGQQVNAGFSAAAAKAPPPLRASPSVSAASSVVLAGSADAITDASGNTWTITNDAQVAVNGVADTSTANVIRLAYVNGAVWHENTGQSRWEKTNPTDAWWPNAGTVTSPLSAGTVTSPLPTASTPTPSISVTAFGTSTDVSATDLATTTVAGDAFVVSAANVVEVTLGATETTLSFVGMSSIALTAGTADAIVTATTGSNSFTAGMGALTVRGGTGADAYVYQSGAGKLTVDDFSTAQGDTLTIDGSLMPSMTESSDTQGGTLLTFGGAGSIDIRNAASLAEIDIRWA